MERTIGIIFLGILNAFTSALNLFITWFMILDMSLSSGEWIDLLVMLTINISIFLEIVKWISFYFVLKRKQTKWLMFYGFYGGLFLILMFSLLQYHPLTLILLMYFVSMFLISKDQHQSFRNTEKKDVSENELSSPSNELVVKSSQTNNVKHKPYFRFGILLLTLPTLVLSYFVYSRFYFLYTYLMLLDVSVSFLFSLSILTLITVISWSVLIQLWKKGHSNWVYYFIVPMAYQFYLFFKAIAMIGFSISLEMFRYPSVTLNILSVIIYTIGLTMLHEEHNTPKNDDNNITNKSK